jgi:integrase
MTTTFGRCRRRHVRTWVTGQTLDWRIFSAWCAAHDLVPMPAAPATVVLFLTDSARTLKPGTLRRRLSSIAVAHELADHASPTSDPIVKTTWKGIRRTLGTAQFGKDPLLARDIATMVRALPDTIIGCRDRCLLLLDFASALRRSELTALDVDDLSFVEDGIVISVPLGGSPEPGRLSFRLPRFRPRRACRAFISGVTL